MAFSAIEPIGEDAAWFRAGAIAAAGVNVHVPKDKTPAKPSDFIPDFWKSGSTAEKPETVGNKVRAVMRAMFGKGQPVEKNADHR